MFQAIEEVVTGMPLGHELGDLGCNLSQLNTFSTVVWSTEENKTVRARADGSILGILLRIQ